MLLPLNSPEVMARPAMNHNCPECPSQGQDRYAAGKACGATTEEMVPAGASLNDAAWCFPCLPVWQVSPRVAVSCRERP